MFLTCKADFEACLVGVCAVRYTYLKSFSEAFADRFCWRSGPFSCHAGGLATPNRLYLEGTRGRENAAWHVEDKRYLGAMLSAAKYFQNILLWHHEVSARTRTGAFIRRVRNTNTFYTPRNGVRSARHATNPKSGQTFSN